MNVETAKSDSAEKPAARLPESQEADGGRGAPQPATSDDEAHAEAIVNHQRLPGTEPAS